MVQCDQFKRHLRYYYKTLQLEIYQIFQSDCSQKSILLLNQVLLSNKYDISYGPLMMSIEKL